MTQAFEEDQSGFAEITSNQATAFSSKIDFLRPLLYELSFDMHETEDFMIGLDLGEYTVEIVDDDTKSADERQSLGKLTLNSLGGLIELGPGIAIPVDPFRYTTETERASFLVGDKGVEISFTTYIAQNLRYDADLTTTTEYKVVVTAKEEDELFEYSREKTYRNIPHDGTAAHKTLKRREKITDGQEKDWVVVAPKDDTLRGIAQRAKMVREGLMTQEEDQRIMVDEAEYSEVLYNDQSIEYPTRFDRNRFSEIMSLLDQIDVTKRTNAAPTPIHQASGFEVVLE